MPGPVAVLPDGTSASLPLSGSRPATAPIARSAVRRQLDAWGVDGETACTAQLIAGLAEQWGTRCQEQVGEQFADRERRLEITFREHEPTRARVRRAAGTGAVINLRIPW
ncbi:hypothetical protein [Streptomyces nojiriensis]|uniref:hypothetical protein n=1 Tax=Streptomyces nojiriensis TaxID=66374 RepID=UPI0035DF4006